MTSRSAILLHFSFEKSFIDCCKKMSFLLSALMNIRMLIMFQLIFLSLFFSMTSWSLTSWSVISKSLRRIFELVSAQTDFLSTRRIVLIKREEFSYWSFSFSSFKFLKSFESNWSFSGSLNTWSTSRLRARRRRNIRLRLGLNRDEDEESEKGERLEDEEDEVRGEEIKRRSWVSWCPLSISWARLKFSRRCDSWARSCWIAIIRCVSAFNWRTARAFAAATAATTAVLVARFRGMMTKRWRRLLCKLLRLND
jgi:hypothetical protein